MIGKKVVSKEPMCLADVKAIIDKRKKEGELSYEQNLTFEYCKKFLKITQKNAEKLIGGLMEKVDKLSKKNAIELCDVMPKKAEEVNLVFAKEHFVLSDEEISAILEVLSKYQK